jgi:hypothetical protein
MIGTPSGMIGVYMRNMLISVHMDIAIVGLMDPICLFMSSNDHDSSLYPLCLGCIP